MPHLQAFLRQIGVYMLAILVLSACGSEPDQASAPTAPLPTPRLVVTPPSNAVRGDHLPGKLLFVRDGVVWRWQDRAAQPLFGDGKTFQPSYSPNGEYIAYVQRGDSYSDILLADSAGRPVSQITNNGGSPQAYSFDRIYQTVWAFYPTWSADNATLVYAAQAGPPTGSPAADYNLTLFQANIGLRSASQIYADAAAHTGRARYLPNSQELAYVREATQRGSLQQIYTLAGNGLTQPLAGAPEGSYDPAFSADGQWAFFAARNAGQTDIWAVARTGNQQPQRLTNLGSARAPTLSPDGSLLAFLAVPAGKGGFELWVSELVYHDDGRIETRAPRQITQDMSLDADSGLSWTN
jgi:TolB protein